LRELEWEGILKNVRQGVNSIADRWARSSRFLRKEDKKYVEKLTKLAKMHSHEAFFSCDDPLEAIIFSVLIEMIKRQENQECFPEIPDNEHPKDGVLSLRYWT
jgi:hypothetical protein